MRREPSHKPPIKQAAKTHQNSGENQQALLRTGRAPADGLQILAAPFGENVGAANPAEYGKREAKIMKHAASITEHGWREVADYPKLLVVGCSWQPKELLERLHALLVHFGA